MRIRLQSSLGNIVLNCWYEVPCPSRDFYVEDLVGLLHADLNLPIDLAHLGLELERFDLPRRSRIEGILRDGDLLTLTYKRGVVSQSDSRSPIQQAVSCSKKISIRQTASEAPSEDSSFVDEDELDTVSRRLDFAENVAQQVMVENNALKINIESLRRSQAQLLSKLESLEESVQSRGLLGKEAPQTIFTEKSGSSVSVTGEIATMASVGSSSEASESESSSSDDTDSSSDSDTSNDPPSILNSRNPASSKPYVGTPFGGLAPTWKRNDRRKRQKQLQRLKAAGILPEDANFRTLEKFQNGEHPQTMNKQRSKSSTPPWNYPHSPESGWESRLVVKVIECEREHDEQLVTLSQTDELVRGRKRSRPETLSSQQALKKRTIPIDPISDDVVITASMYDSPQMAPVVTNGLAPIVHQHPTAELSDGELTPDSEADLPFLPEDITSLPSLTAHSPGYAPNAIIAFKFLTMTGFRPEISKYLVARVTHIYSATEEIEFQVAKRDEAEDEVDYEGERVPGPFDVFDQHGNVIRGRLRMFFGDLIEPLLLVSGASRNTLS